MAIIEQYTSLIVGGFSLITGLILFVVNLVNYVKRFKKAKTSEERDAILNEIKGAVFGFITIAEETFKDIPQSGASKLLYVLKKTAELCEMNGVEFVQDDWEAFVNNVVEKSNLVQDSKVYEDEKAKIIDEIKTSLNDVKAEADNLFSGIPDAVRYKIEYVLSKVETFCNSYAHNVYGEHDWRAYVENLYSNEVTE